MSRRLLVLLIVVMVLNIAYAQDTYTKTEIDAKLELYDEKISSRVREIENEEKRVTDMSNNLDRTLAIIGVIIAVFGILGFNKLRSLRSDVETHKSSINDSMRKMTDEALKEMTIIKDATKEHLSKAELHKQAVYKQDESERLVVLISQLGVADVPQPEKVKLLQEVGAQIVHITKVKPIADYTSQDWFLKGYQASEEGRAEDAQYYYRKIADTSPEFEKLLKKYK